MTYREPEEVVTSEEYDDLDKGEVRKLIKKFVKAKLRFRAIVVPGKRIVVVVKK